MKILKSAPATTTGMIRHRWRKASPTIDDLAVRHAYAKWRVLQYSVMKNPDNVAAGWAEPAWSDWMDVPVED